MNIATHRCSLSSTFQTAILAVHYGGGNRFVIARRIVRIYCSTPSAIPLREEAPHASRWVVKLSVSRSALIAQQREG